MADELDALRRVTEQLPTEVIAALRAVAWRASHAVKDRALEILNTKTGGKADRIATITIVEDAAEHVFNVIAEGPADKPANLALWFERGTRFMVARPFLRPAADVVELTYRSESLAAATRVVDKLSNT